MVSPEVITTRVNRDLLRWMKILSDYQDISLYDYMSEAMRMLIKRDEHLLQGLCDSVGKAKQSGKFGRFYISLPDITPK